jgi:hypothetical protein
MWIIVSLIFAIAALFSGDTNFWIIFGLMIIANNLEYLAIQVKKLQKDEEEKINT